LAIKRMHEIQSFVTVWTELEMVVLSETGQAQKDKKPMMSPICGI
jgi:hypothetical protein